MNYQQINTLQIYFSIIIARRLNTGLNYRELTFSIPNTIYGTETYYRRIPSKAQRRHAKTS
jgi:hypothetical protein